MSNATDSGRCVASAWSSGDVDAAIESVEVIGNRGLCLLTWISGEGSRQEEQVRIRLVLDSKGVAGTSLSEEKWRTN